MFCGSYLPEFSIGLSISEEMNSSLCVEKIDLSNFPLR